MNTRRLLILTAASALALGGLSGCATPFQADVARFHAQLPPAQQGQSFTVMPDNPRLAGSLEFDHYADLVAQHLARYGYVRSADPAAAKLVVRLQYHVDKGVQRVRVSNWGRSGFYDPFYYGGWGGYGYGWGRPYMLGYNDPFMWGPSSTDIDSYLVYHSELRLRIDKAGGEHVFEGTAQAQSLSNEMTYLVPNLVDALFKGFPGQDGENIKVTIAPPKK